MIDSIMMEFNTYLTNNFVLNASVKSSSKIYGIGEAQVTIKFEKIKKNHRLKEYLY